MADHTDPESGRTEVPMVDDGVRHGNPTRRAMLVAGVAGTLPLAIAACGTTQPIPTPAQLAPGEQVVRAAGLDARDYGLRWDGAADDTAAIQRSLDAAAASGGGNVLFPVGIGCFSGEIGVPPGVNIVGQGNGKGVVATTFKATADSAKFKFGTPKAGVGNRAGVTGGFVVDGNRVALNPFHLELCVQRYFEAIDILNGVDSGLLIERAQNNLFTSISIEDCPTGTGIVLDKGTGGNLFIRTEVNNCKVLVAFQQTEPTPSLYPVPTHNKFLHCVIERPTQDANVAISHTAGVNNYLDTCMVAASRQYDNELTLIKIEQSGDTASGPLYVLGGQIQGNSANVVGIDVGPGASAVIRNSPIFLSLVKGVTVGDRANVDVDGFRSSNVNEVFTGASDTYAQFRLNSPIAQTRYAPDNTAYQIVWPDGYPSFRLMADGGLSWFRGGTFVRDTVLERAAAGVIRGDSWATRVNTQIIESDGAIVVPVTMGFHAIQLGADVTEATMEVGALGQEITIEWVQDAHGQRRYSWPTICRFAGGGAPRPSVGGGQRDLVTFVYDGAVWCEKSRSVGISG